MGGAGVLSCYAASANPYYALCSKSRSSVFPGTIDGPIFAPLPPPPAPFASAHQALTHAVRASGPAGSNWAPLALCAASESSFSGPALSCLTPHGRLCSRKSKGNVSTSAMTKSGGSVVKKEATAALPDHLLVLVHGILASPSDWKYVQGELTSKLGNSYLIHASNVNSYLQTLGGIDLAGKRLADEVLLIVKKTPTLRKISFVAHSLGGLFARFAIAVLYEPPIHSGGNSAAAVDETQASLLGTIAGLQPITLVTLATPHLGVRGKKQLPFLLGVSALEKIAAPLAPVITGRTGRQLFLTDGKASDRPLLLRMSSDCKDGQFISALRAFKLRVLYANVSYDHLVGWRTSSIRRESELVKPPKHSLKGYKHVVGVTDSPAVECSDNPPKFPGEAAKAKEAAQIDPSSKVTAPYHDVLEEEMIKSLQRLSWRKVDVSFHSALWPFLAHNHIHVKQEWLFYEGAGVVVHVADTIKEQDLSAQFSARL